MNFQCYILEMVGGIRNHITKNSGTCSLSFSHSVLSFSMTSRIPPCIFCYASNKLKLPKSKREMALIKTLILSIYLFRLTYRQNVLREYKRKRRNVFLDSSNFLTLKNIWRVIVKVSIRNFIRRYIIFYRYIKITTFEFRKNFNSIARIAKSLYL